MNTPNQNQKHTLKDTVFKRIEDEQVCPRSRVFFHSQECFVWAMWFLSVVVGAFAVAISLFVVTHRQYALYEATHDNFFTFLVGVLPYLWVIVFGLMVFAAVYNLKLTKRGYRYPVPFILASSVVLSFAGGSAMQFFGLGYEVDELLGQHMSVYRSQTKLEHALWQDADDGRLIGKQVLSTVAPTTTVIFQDVDGERWRMEVLELHPEDIKLLASGKKVRVLGSTVNTSAPVFHACGVFPWMLDKDFSRDEMSEERENFLERTAEHMHRVEEKIALYELETYSSSSPETMALCTELAAMKRIMRSKPQRLEE